MRNNVTFAGPGDGCVVVVGRGFNVFVRKLLVLEWEELLVEVDILWEAIYPDPFGT